MGDGAVLRLGAKFMGMAMSGKAAVDGESTHTGLGRCFLQQRKRSDCRPYQTVYSLQSFFAIMGSESRHDWRLHTAPWKCAPDDSGKDSIRGPEPTDSHSWLATSRGIFL